MTNNDVKYKFLVGSFGLAENEAIHLLEWDESSKQIREIAGTKGIEAPSYLTYDAERKMCYAMLISFLHHFLWFFGLHGTNILAGVIEPIYLPFIERNADLFARGMSAYDVPYIITKPFFDVFVYMGGAGTSIALIVAVFIVIQQEKNHPYREISKLAAPAGIFNINEPIIFGIPIVFNPIFFCSFYCRTCCLNDYLLHCFSKWNSSKNSSFFTMDNPTFYQWLSSNRWKLARNCFTNY